MYERFLETELYVSGGGKGQVAVRPNRYARKSGGSYYTPEELVQLVIDGSVGILLKEYKADFTAAIKNKTPLAKLKKLDPAMRGLQLKRKRPFFGIASGLSGRLGVGGNGACTSRSAKPRILLAAT